MGSWMNLYTFLMDHVDIKFCFGDRTQEYINNGKIQVNRRMPDDINMPLITGDIVNDKDYIVEQKHLI
jgi:hypothetical protein